MLLKAVIWNAVNERIPGLGRNSLATHIYYDSNLKNKIKYKAAFKHIPGQTTVVALTG